jgi:hypothetical protein
MADPALEALALEAVTLAGSGLFDAVYYESSSGPSGEVRRLGPLLGFCLRGWRQGLSPGPLFDTMWYLSTYPDVYASGMNPATHFLFFGWREGRKPCEAAASVMPSGRAGLGAPLGRIPVMIALQSGEGRHAYCADTDMAERLRALWKLAG